jgi:elongation factor 1-alpha
VKQEVNLAICGHAWHGKSTLVGKTVVEMGMVDPRTVEQYEREAARGRDASLVFALLVFRTKDPSADKTQEAARGITILPSFVRFEFKTHRVLVVDTPGQETYTNNRFGGIFSADAAALIVDVTDGIKPITEQVVRILKGYEVPLAAVIATKMDRVGFEEEPFRLLERQVRELLRSHEVSDEKVQFIPTSAYATGRPLMEKGEGLTRFDKITWAKGPTFQQLMQSLDLPIVRPKSPLRIAIHAADAHDQVPGIGKAFTGLVETGAVKKDMKLLFEPLSADRGEPITAEVRSVELTKGHIATPGIPVEAGLPRQVVGVALRQVSTKDKLKELFRTRHGVIAGEESAPPGVARELLAEVTVFEGEAVLKPGHVVTLHAHYDHVGVEVVAVEGIRPATGGEWTTPAEPKIATGEWGRIRLKAQRPIAIEEAGKLAPLAKLVLREGMKPIAYGRCVKILA